MSPRGIIGKILRGVESVTTPASLEFQKAEIMRMQDERRAELEDKRNRVSTLSPEETTAAGLPAGSVAQRDHYGKLSVVASPEKRSVSGMIIEGSDGSPELNQTYLDGQRELERIKDGMNPDLIEVGDPSSPTGTKWVNKNEAVGMPGKGTRETPSADNKKYLELTGMGIPDHVARATAYGLYQEVKDQRGNPMLINLEDGGLVGSMVRDPKTGQYSWQTNTRNAGAEAVYGDVPRNQNQREAGKVYKTPRGLMKWTGKGWLPQ